MLVSTLDNNNNNNLDHHNKTRLAHANHANKTSHPSGQPAPSEQSRDGADEESEPELADNLGLDPYAYLSKFGYTPADESITSEPIKFDSLNKAIKLYQSFFGLQPGDDVNEPTLSLMRRPRCGNVDVDEGQAGLIRADQKKTYAKSNYKWPKRKVSYKIVRAFEVWAREANIDFYSLSSGRSEADIEISFVRSNYGTCYRCSLFAGSPTQLAHAYYPDEKSHVGGDIHFNDLIDWSLADIGGEGENLLAVALHEIGHSLGLGHGQFAKTKMYPMINGSMSALDRFDVAGIVAIYGRRPKTLSHSEPNPTQPTVD